MNFLSTKKKKKINRIIKIFNKIKSTFGSVSFLFSSREMLIYRDLTFLSAQRSNREIQLTRAIAQEVLCCFNLNVTSSTIKGLRLILERYQFTLQCLVSQLNASLILRLFLPLFCQPSFSWLFSNEQIVLPHFFPFITVIFQRHFVKPFPQEHFQVANLATLPRASGSNTSELASLSALSFPSTPEYPGIHRKLAE